MSADRDEEFGIAHQHLTVDIARHLPDRQVGIEHDLGRRHVDAQVVFDMVAAGRRGGQFGIFGAADPDLSWGIDNNLTRKLSSADPVQIAMIKGLIAGSTNLVLALSLGASLPGAGHIGAGALVGFLGVGVSLVMFMLALRHLGTARTGAYFSLAPFIGAVLAIAIFHDSITWQLAEPAS